MKPLLCCCLVVCVIFSCRQQPIPHARYSLSGKGQTTLVFVHGWCINRSYWQAQEEKFRSDYQIVTIDLAGHDEDTTANSLQRIEAYADDVVHLVESLGLERIVLIGHSMAGDINLHVYEKIPQRVVGFIGIDNFHELGKEYTAEENKQTEEVLALMQNDFVTIVRQYAEASLFAPQTDSSVRARVLYDITKARKDIAVAELRSLAVQNVEERRIAPKLTIPLMLIHSDRSPINEEYLKKYCGKGYRIRSVHGSGHYPMIEVPDEFNSRLAETLREIEGK